MNSRINNLSIKIDSLNQRAKNFIFKTIQIPHTEPVKAIRKKLN